ncbi:Serpentine Receptor, class E (Epsilon) [Caenorhabditis elegans]|uniref:Serpentine Receptor, class E (Epsilon) n=1 Tax=Caenorhabditis elegans TaxID=6239 RepID=Q9XWH6_CAEEL|nr:Serpentine Receptor, class E (Epsilon) [Caenorhabditis elegans]CAA21692.1 Serpentine Receptor, class E (Epsilon) [Caenorhabditis elegans]|eukprot:NP_496628.1 Serpentine Receptor, class E (epsilon) [Caenorhabditis elegans]
MIIAFLNSTETLWIPVFSLNDRVYESPIYPFFAAIQILIYCSTAYIIVRTCKIITKIRLFHENKNILMAFFLCQWFEAILAKILILPYQIGLIQIGNSPGKSYFSWWSSGRNDMVLVESTDDIRVLYIACYVYRHYMFSMFFGIMAIGVERACATFYIHDYEHVRRRHIPVILIILVNIITIPYVYFVIHNRIPFLVVYGQWAVCIVLSTSAYATILRINFVFRNQMRKNITDHEKYSLARKFQVEENIRSLKLAKYTVLVGSVHISLTLLVFTCLMLGFFERLQVFFVHILENLILLPALVMAVALLCCSVAWRHEFMQKLPVLGKHISGTSRIGISESRRSVVLESEVYFQQLRSSWN